MLKNAGLKLFVMLAVGAAAGACSAGGGNTGGGGSGNAPKCDPACPDGYECSDEKVCVPAQTTGDPVPTGNDTTTDAVDTTITPNIAACQPCAETSECEDGLLCVSVGPTKHCTEACADDSDCASGWVCFASGDTSSCVPGLFQCTGCMQDGCPDAATPWCNASSGNCVSPSEQCGACEKDGQCGAGMRCWQKACVPECNDGTCPDNASCAALEGGANVCKWITEGACCLGADCTGTVDPCTACGGATPYCVGESCVECMNDTHCTQAKPKCQGNVCMEADAPPECSGTTPHKNPTTGACCACLNDSHCNGGKCDGCACKAPETGNEVCDTCTAPYPGCADFQGQWVCVQCSEDAHCPGSTCNLQNYTCEGTTGTGPTSGECQDEGCTDASLSCDTETGLCYADDGSCDNTTKFCPGGGDCIDFFTQLGMGGGGGGLPPLPGLPDILPSNCGCTSDADCPGSATCGENGLAALLNPGGGGTLPKVCQAAAGLPFP